ncbi:MAG: hypothetical protein ABI042_16635 [Verrucomicrobiota bacterium]
MFAASIESLLIFLLIAGGSALVNWLKKRGERADDWSPTDMSSPSRKGTPSNSPVPRPAANSTNWEEELRRMLEGAAPKPPARPPPPVISQEQKTSPPLYNRPVATAPKSSMYLPKVFDEKYYKAHCNNCDGHIDFPSSAMEQVISCPHCQHSTVLRPFENTRVEEIAHQKTLTEFNESSRKYEEASQLSQRVAAHMHGVGHQAVGLTAIESVKKLWPEVAETKALFKNAKTVRQAVIASLILGPPKALEN